MVGLKITLGHYYIMYYVKGITTFTVSTYFIIVIPKYVLFFYFP